MKSKISQSIIKTISQDKKIDQRKYLLIINQGIESYVLETMDTQDYKKEIQNRSRNHLIKNMVFQKWFYEFSDKVEELKIEVVALKGIVLLDLIYADPSKRTLGDIDLLVSNEKKDQLINYLERTDFIKTDEGKWYGNNFKVTLTKNFDGIQIAVEIHTKLFFNEEHIQWKTIPFKNDYMRMLNHSDFLVHMMGHLSYQHTFIKINWLIDIEHFYTKYQAEIDINRVFSLIEALKHQYSYQAVVKALSLYKIELPRMKESKLRKSLLHLVLDKSFLLRPASHKASYFLLKHITKASWLESIKYDIKWLCYQIKMKLKNSF